MFNFFWITALVVGLIFLVFIFFVVKSYLYKKGHLKKSLNTSLFLVKVPKEIGQTQDDSKKTEKEVIAVMEQLYASLAELKQTNKFKQWLYRSPHLSFEIAIESLGEDIGFYLSVPKRLEDTIEKQIYSFFTGAEIKKVRDYTIFNPKGKEAAAFLKLKNSNLLPIRTYQDLEADPISDLTTALSKIDQPGEGAAIQVLIRSAPNGWSKSSKKIIESVQKGHSIDSLLGKSSWSVGSFFGDLLRAIVEPGKSPKSESGQEKKEFSEVNKLTPLQEEAIQLIQKKTGKAAFLTNIRLVTSANNQTRADELLEHLINGFTQFSAINFNSFKGTKAPRGKFKAWLKKSITKSDIIYYFIFRIFDDKRCSILNTEELVSIFHFPIASVSTPKLKWLKAKLAPPPVNLPGEGLVLGKNNYRGQETVIKINRSDRRRHLYAIGQTGTGKSSFMQELIRQDIEKGEGVGVIDPHGELCEAILGLIPENRRDDVVYFNPPDTDKPIGLNMLEYGSEEEKDFAVGEMMAIFHKLFPPEYIGPMFEHYMRNAMLTLMADPDELGTIIEIPRIFTDDEFTNYKVSKLSDPIVRSFWEKEWAKTTPQTKSEMLGYLISKIGALVENRMMRNIIGQPKSGFNFREVMDNQKILLINLSKGKVGELNSSLLGLIIVSKLQMAAMSRTDIPAEERKDFYLYIDEFQNFTTPSISAILSEARKYRLCLTLAHQFIGQLSDDIRNSVFGNVGNMVSFRVSAEDGEFISKQFEPVFNQSDLINIDNFNAYAKLQISGETSRAFNLASNKPIEPKQSRLKEVCELSRHKYGRSKAEVEAEILRRSNLGSEAKLGNSRIVKKSEDLPSA